MSCFYIDNHSYQENILVKKHVEQGHDVKVLASTEIFNKDKKIDYTEPSTYLGTDGASVTRLPYSNFLPHIIMKKLRVHPGVYKFISEFSPDVIVFHGLCGWELLTVIDYIKNSPSTKLWVDSHEDSVNSGRSFVSKYFLHWFYYRSIARYAVKHLNEVLCVSVSTIEFLRNFYNLPEEKLVFYPLGGEIFDDKDYFALRDSTREKYNVRQSEVLIVQTGKMTARKKLRTSLNAFRNVPSLKARFIIAGVIDSDDKDEIFTLINEDSRVDYVGWLSSEEIDALLCATDIYLQPGTQSATMQNSLCKRCVIIIDDISAHEPYINGNGWLLNKAHNIQGIFQEIQDLNIDIEEMKVKSYRLAQDMLDYDLLSKKLTDI